MYRIESLLNLFPLSLILLLQCSSIEDKSASQKSSFEIKNSKQGKINGVSFVSPPDEFVPELMQIPSHKIAANWMCFMPFGFIQSESNEVQFNSEWQWWGEKTEGVFSMIQMAQKQQYKTMLKPQIWIRHGEFTGHHTYEKETDWQAFESSYSKFILTYAHMADSINTDLFCIGTELEQFVIHRPQYWKNLILKVRTIYTGKITYAANWDEFSTTPFWNLLDYIGIDGYFPLNTSKSPSISDLRKAWLPHKKQMSHFADSIDKTILFTEYGFRSRDYSTDKPWESERGGTVNHEIQKNAYSALFQEIWKEDFFAGGFLWKWFPNYNEVGGLSNTGFTPQRKPVEEVIKKYYSLNSGN